MSSNSISFHLLVYMAWRTKINQLTIYRGNSAAHTLQAPQASLSLVLRNSRKEFFSVFRKHRVPPGFLSDTERADGKFHRNRVG